MQRGKHKDKRLVNDYVEVKQKKFLQPFMSVTGIKYRSVKNGKEMNRMEKHLVENTADNASGREEKV